jgi:parallel beta-helix repeat protein
LEARRMKKLNIFVFIIVALLIIISAFPLATSLKATNDIIYVDDDGGTDYTCIQDAIDNASNGDTVYVYSGVYYENVIVDKSIELIGENKDTTIIDGTRWDTVTVIAEDVKITRFTIQNTDKDWPDDCRGICIYSNKINILDNIIRNNNHGIFLMNASDINISGNQFVDNNWALVMGLSHNVIVSYNNIYYNENEHDYVHHSGISVYESTEFSISHNIITTDVGLSLTLEFSSDVEVFLNKITGAWCGIILRGCNNMIISKNTLENNGYGIELSTSANIEIIQNNFIDNRLNAFFSKSIYWDAKLRLPLISNNKWDGNYWDRIRFSPYPIFGGMGWIRPTEDFVYHPITWITFDWHPAKQPYDFEGEYTEQPETVYEDPLSFRVEFKKLFDRIWRINCYATNTFDEDIKVRWGCPPFVYAFFYKIQDEDLNLYVKSYNKRIYNYNKWFEFEPGEEKLIDSSLFIGISNMFTYGLSEGYFQYIDTWPILPNGVYEFRASLSPYQNENYEMLSMGEQETIIFEYS